MSIFCRSRRGHWSVAFALGLWSLLVAASQPDISGDAPFAVSVSRNVTATTFSAPITLSVAPGDRGRDLGIYLVAGIAGQWFVHEGKRWLPYSGGPLPAYLSLPMPAQLPIYAIDNLPLAGLSGTRLYLGYGSNDTEMLAARRYRHILTIEPDGARPAPGGSNLPACPADPAAPLFNALPIATTDFSYLRPLGHVNVPEHVLPNDHHAFILGQPGDVPAVQPVFSPGELWVTTVRSTAIVGENKTGYTVYVSPCNEFLAYFGHLSKLSPALAAAIAAPRSQSCSSYSFGLKTANYCNYELRTPVHAGDLLGYSGDASGVDFGATDQRIPPLPYANPAHYGGNQHYVVSPVPYFSTTVRAILEPRLAAYDGTPRRGAPSTGAVMQDLPGTAQGNWFPPGINPALPAQSEAPYLALIHDYIGAAEPVFSLGTSVPGVNSGVYGYGVQADGQINRDFKDIVPAGGIYCFDLASRGSTSGHVPLSGLDGVLILALPTATTLKIEKLGHAGDSCTALRPWAFGAGAANFER